MQPCETTPTTTSENRDSQGYLLSVDEPSRPSGASRSSGVYSYAYDHLRDRFIAFLSIHLRHIQDLYARRNSGFRSRSCSVPSTQAPSPPDHTPPSSPLIPPPPPTGEDSRTVQQLCSRDETLECKAQTLSRVSFSPECTCPNFYVTTINESMHFYENVPNNEMTDYADVVTCI